MSSKYITEDVQRYLEEQHLSTDFTRKPLCFCHTLGDVLVSGFGEVTLTELAAYWEWKQRDQQLSPSKEKGFAFLPGMFRKGTSRHKERDKGVPDTYWRQSHLVTELHWLFLDIEEYPIGSSIAAVRSYLDNLFPSYAWVGFSSWNHGNPAKWTPEEPRIRVVLSFQSPVSVEQYKTLYDLLLEHVGGLDSACKDVCRLNIEPRKKNPDATVDPFILTSRLSQYEYNEKREIDISEFVLRTESGVQTFDIIAMTRQRLERRRQRVEERRQRCENANFEAADADDIQNALEFVNDAEDYDTWLTVGMALHAAVCEGDLDEAVALAIWDDWSAQASNYEQDAIDYKWDSFTTESRNEKERLTLGSLFKLAKDNGYIAPRKVIQSHGVPGPCSASSLTNLPNLDGDSDTEIANYVKENWYQTTVSAAPRTGEVLWSNDGLEEGAEVDICDFLNDDMEQTDIVWDLHDRYGYDLEDGLWTIVPDDELLRIVKNGMFKLPIVVGEDPDTGQPIFKPFKASLNKAKNAIKFIDADAKMYANFFYDFEKFSALACANCTLVWHRDNFVRIDGRKTPLQARIKYRVPVDYDPNADYSYWENFLLDCMVPGQRDFVTGKFVPDQSVTAAELDEAWSKIECLKQYMGATLFEEVHRAQKIIMLKGPGGGGKTVTLDTLQKLFDPTSVSHVSPQAMGERFAPAELAGKMLNILGDVDRADLINTGRLKQIVGGDKIQVERKHKDPFNIVYRGGNIFSCNELPATRDRSLGFWQRWVLLEFPIRIRGTAKEDEQIWDRLEERLDSILTWAVEGFKAFVANDYKLHVPQSSDDLIRIWRKDTDSCRDYVERALLPPATQQSTAWMSASEAYDDYKAWAPEVGRKPVNDQAFYKALKQMHDDGMLPHKKPGNRSMYPLSTISKRSQDKLTPFSQGEFDLNDGFVDDM